MPKYQVQDPDSGRSLVLEGDSAPTEQELEQIFKTAAPTTTKTGTESAERKSVDDAPYGVETQDKPSFDAKAAQTGINAALGITGAIRSITENPAADEASAMGQKQIQLDEQAKASDAADVAASLNRNLPKSGEQSTLYGGPPKKLATYAETMESLQEADSPLFRTLAPRQSLSEPRIDYKIPVDSKEGFISGATKELANTALSVPEFFTSDLGVLTVLTGKLAPSLVSAGFSVDMIKATYDNLKQTVSDWDKLTGAQKGQAVVRVLGTALFAGMATKHAGEAAVKRVRQEASPAGKLSQLIEDSTKEDFTPNPDQYNSLAMRGESMNVPPVGAVLGDQEKKNQMLASNAQLVKAAQEAIPVAPMTAQAVAQQASIPFEAKPPEQKSVLAEPKEVVTTPEPKAEPAPVLSPTEAGKEGVVAPKNGDKKTEPITITTVDGKTISVPMEVEWDSEIGKWLVTPEGGRAIEQAKWPTSFSSPFHEDYATRDLESYAGVFGGTQETRSNYRKLIESAVGARKPVSVEGLKDVRITPSKGYEKSGDVYVYKKEAEPKVDASQTGVETPISVEEKVGDEQSKLSPTPPSEQPVAESVPEGGGVEAKASPTLEKVSVGSVDIPAQGVLNQAKELKANTWKRLKALRQQVKDLGPKAGNLRLELLKAESSHREALSMERGALGAIEKRANELGQTTKPANPTPVAEKPVEAKTEAPKSRNALKVKSDNRPPDIIDDILEIGPINVKSTMKKGQEGYYGETFSQIYEGAKGIKGLWKSNGLGPDDVVKGLILAGKVSPDFTVDNLWDAIEKGTKSRRAYNAGETPEARMDAFWKAVDTTKGTKNKKKEIVNSGDLKQGETVTVNGEEMTVDSVDLDNGEIYLKGGKKFDRQRIPDATDIAIDRGSHTKLPEADTEWTVPEPEATKVESPKPEEPAPKLPDGIEPYAGAKGLDSADPKVGDVVWTQHPQSGRLFPVRYEGKTGEKFDQLSVEKWTWLDGPDKGASDTAYGRAFWKPEESKPTPKPKAGGDLFGAEEMPFNLAGEQGTAAPKPSEALKGSEALAQGEMFDIQKIVANADPVKTADAAQQMYGGARNAIDKIENQLRVIDSDPKTKKDFSKEQRDRLKEVVALLRQREAKDEPAKPIGMGDSAGPGTGEGPGSPTGKQGPDASSGGFQDQSGRDIYGVAQRVREQRAKAGQVAPVQIGKGVSPAEVVKWGQDLIAMGVDAEQSLKNFEKDPGKSVSVDLIAVTRAHGEALAKAASDIESKFGTDSVPYRTAKAALDSWDARSKKIDTAAGDALRSLQGHTDIDTGTFTGLNRAYRDITGKDLDPSQAKSANRIAKGVTDADKKATEGVSTLQTEIDKIGEPIEPAIRRLADKIIKAMDDRANAALDRIKARQAEGRLFTGVDPTELKDVAIYGAAKITKGIVEFGAWSAEMISDIGEGIRPYLKEIYDLATKDEESETTKLAGGSANAEKVKAARKSTKIPTDIVEQRKSFQDYKSGQKMTNDQLRTLWIRAKSEYIDKGNEDMADIVNKLGTDLGLPVNDVLRGLNQNRSVKRVADDVWQKQRQARLLKQSARRWVENAQKTWLQKTIPAAARFMFSAKVAGHGAVAIGTHAPLVMATNPIIGAKNFGKMYKMILSPDYYRMESYNLKNRPNYDVAQRAKLVNDPSKMEDFNDPLLAQRFPKMAEFFRERLGKLKGLQGAGTRGYTVLKLLRQDLFDQHWDKLSESEKTPDMAKAIAATVNHITGVTETKLPDSASLALFAPKLLYSRIQLMAGDPIRAANSVLKMGNITPEEKWFALNQVKEKAKIFGVFTGLLAANQQLNNLFGDKKKLNGVPEFMGGAGFNPMSSDFMKFRVAGMNVAWASPFLTLSRLPMRLIQIGMGDGGKSKFIIYPDESMYKTVGSYARTQTSPALSPVLSLLMKGDYENRPLPQIPGYGPPPPVPSRLKAKGIKPYTWPEFAAQTFLPIPAQEAAKEVWHYGLGSTPEQQKALLKAFTIITLMAGTGGRIQEDWPANTGNSPSPASVRTPEIK